MPEYLAPGVYIEEVSYRAKTIEGVSTSTAGFVGATRYGPIEGEPELLTSFAAFERIYGSMEPLLYGTTNITNYLAHAVRAFFENGGTRLYVTRAYRHEGSGDYPGYAQWPETPAEITLRARYPGAAGNMLVTFTFRIGQNVLATNTNGNIVLRGAANYDLVWVADGSSPPASGALYWLEPYFDATTQRNTYRLRRNDADDSDTTDAIFLTDPSLSEVRIITVNVTVATPGQESREQTWENLSFHPDHRQALTKVFAAEPRSRSTALYVPLVIEVTAVNNGVTIVEALLNLFATSPPSDPLDPAASETSRIFQALLTGGDDGVRPTANEFEGEGDDDPRRKSGLKAFENIADISIVAAPGTTYGYSNGYQTQAEQITGLLISHCERMRYRIAVLDAADNQVISEVRQYRGQIDSTHAALYYPWVTTVNPLDGEEINLPPSGFVAGIYARNDVEKGVHKAPANEVVRLAIGFEALLNKAQQDVLNPEGINCFRFFDGRGYRLWGARTISSDPEWKYVNLRRYFAYLERSIELGTQWVVFENNDHRLWANVRRTVEDFLFNEWKSGRLFGEKPEEAYFVRCDRSTMTQNDLDNGRLICLVGVAPVRPAEFVIFRIGQWTAERRG
ncbi:MAG: phage tail sheath subtilisin-like domain-containing protein [Ardenticatenaceae bacterium]|nr:phage tail sheath subtilisin-like domain-containing protein [Ardenticatenaceae bacterium]